MAVEQAAQQPGEHRPLWDADLRLEVAAVHLSRNPGAIRPTALADSPCLPRGPCVTTHLNHAAGHVFTDRRQRRLASDHHLVAIDESSVILLTPPLYPC